MIAFITGATGFIGSHLVEALLQKGFQVRALIRETSNIQWLKGLQAEFVQGGLSGKDFPSEALRGVDYVFHLAGVIQAGSRKEYFEVNVEGTRRLLEAAAREAPALKKFVLVSSQAAGGPSRPGGAVREDDPPAPVSYYGESKLESERVVLEFREKFPLVILRPPTIYGPRERRFFTAFRMMRWGLALGAAGSEPKFVSFCYIDDLIEALLLAAFKPCASGRIYNVAGPQPSEWREVVREMGRALQRRYLLISPPRFALYALGVLGEFYSFLTRRPTLLTRRKAKEFSQTSWVIDGKRIREELGWEEKTPLAEGLRETARWYRQAGWL